jgi:hypothetical protein
VLVTCAAPGAGGCVRTPPADEPRLCGYATWRRVTLDEQGPACDRGDLDACATVADVYREGGYAAPLLPADAAVLYARACRGGVARACEGLAGLVGAETCVGDSFGACVEALCAAGAVAREGASVEVRTLVPERRADVGCDP